MTILYAANQGVYVNLREQPPKQGDRVYVNLTNRCPCACVFCLRNTKQMKEENTLWLEREPECQEVIDEFERYDLSCFSEVIFCGFGEPLMRADCLIEVARYLKRRRPDLPIRINTNGLADLVSGKEIEPELAGWIDTVSISLNASTPEEYLRLTRNPFGLASHSEMIRFAVRCKQYLPHVVFTVVDCIGAEEISACQTLCDSVGIPLRVRPYEE